MIVHGLVGHLAYSLQPMHPCTTCGGDRPAYEGDGYRTCLACRTVQIDSTLDRQENT